MGRVHYYYTRVLGIFALAALLWVRVVSAVSEPIPVAQSKAVYTKKGLERIQENISILGENIQQTESNLSHIDQNIVTITNELKEIQKLSEDYAELKAKFGAKIRTAKDEIDQNDSALRKLDKYTRSLEQAKKKQGDTQVVRLQQESAMREIAERERWKLDAMEKLKKLHSMLADIEQAARFVRGKLPQLQRELVGWKSQSNEFKTALEDFKKRRAHFEELMVQRTVSSERGAP